MTATEERVLMASDLPFEQRMCPHLRTTREGPTVSRIRTPAGDEAWLVSGHQEIKTLLRDERLGRSHPDEDRAQYAGSPTYDRVMSEDHGTADAMHHGLRALLKPLFAAKRMLALQPRLTELVELQVDHLVSVGPPADLRTEFSAPLIRLVFCEMLGVPQSEQPQCAALMASAGEDDMAGLFGYLIGLVPRIRATPDESMISRLCEAGVTDEQVLQIVMLLHFAGFGATSKQIDYGFLLLAESPTQRAAIAADPGLLPDAVEELLRMAGSLSLPRYARTDLEVGDTVIPAGALVLLDLTQANYDADAFPDPAAFDPTRTPNRHLTFSHGIWTCLGAPLARPLLHTVFGTVLTRLPDLRPATPLTRHSGPLSGGLPERLEVTW